VLTVAGKFDQQRVIDTIADAFEPIAAPDRVLPREYTIEPVQDGERRVTLRRSGGTPLAATVYRITSGGDPDYPALELATMMLSDVASGRLYKALVQADLASDVFGFARDMYGPGTVMFGAQLKPGMDPEAALEAMTATLENLQDNPFTEEELNRARSQWMNGWDELYSNVQRIGVAISEPIAQGDWRLMFKNRDRIKEVTLADVQRVVDDYLVPANRTEGLYIPTENPERAPAKQRFDIEPLLEGYVGDIRAEMVEAFDPTPANIDKLTERRVLNLASGPVKMALLNKPTRGQRVQADILVQFGDLESLKGKATISSVTASLLDAGTDAMTRQQIRDRLEELNADLFIGGSGTGVSLSISTTSKNLPATIELGLHILKHANFPTDELDEQITQAITNIKANMAEPGALASRTLARYDNPWPADDLRYVPTFEESIQRYEAITRGDLVAFHNAFYGAGNISVAVVGTFDPEAVVQTVSTALKDWRRAPAYSRVPDPYQPIEPTLIRIDTPDKANAVFLARLPLQIQDNNPDYPALVLGNYLLGGSSNSRLWMRIRETDGLSYDVRSMLAVSAFEPNGSLRLSGIFAPENWEKFETAMNEELQRALTEGFSEQEVADGIQSILNLRQLNRAQDGVLASAWLDYMQENRTFAWSAQFDEKLKALDAETVNNTLRKYIKPEGLAQALAGDFNKAKTETTD
jgi:zinc protease